MPRAQPCNFSSPTSPPRKVNRAASRWRATAVFVSFMRSFFSLSLVAQERERERRPEPCLPRWLAAPHPFRRSYYYDITFIGFAHSPESIFGSCVASFFETDMITDSRPVNRLSLKASTFSIEHTSFAVVYKQKAHHVTASSL